MNLVNLIKQSAEKKIIYTLHALDEMNAEEYLAIITAYIPSVDKWDKDFRTRRKR